MSIQQTVKTRIEYGPGMRAELSSRAGTFRISRTDGNSDTVATCYSTDELVEHARQYGPGRYHVDEFLDSSHRYTCRKFGDVLHHADGTVEIEPAPWND